MRPMTPMRTEADGQCVASAGFQALRITRTDLSAGAGAQGVDAAAHLLADAPLEGHAVWLARMGAPHAPHVGGDRFRQV